MKKIILLIREKVEYILTFVAVTLTYLIGIGLTSLVAKLFRQSFLKTTPSSNSNWQTIAHKNWLNNKMF